MSEGQIAQDYSYGINFAAVPYDAWVEVARGLQKARTPKFLPPPNL